MRILLISYYFPPVMNVGGFRALSWAERWRALGHEVVVLTSDGTERGFCAPFTTEEAVGVPCLRVRNPIQDLVNAEYASARAARPSMKQRLKRYLPILDSSILWAREAEKTALREVARVGAFDFVVSTAFPASDHLVAWRLSRRTGAAWVADFRDWYGEIEGDEPDRAWTRRLWLKALFRRWSRDMRFATTVSPGLADFLRADFPEARIEVVYNGYFEGNYRGSTATTPEFEILYTGSWGETIQPLLPLFEAIRLLRTTGKAVPTIRFTGGENEALKRALPADIQIEFVGSFTNREMAARQGRAGFLLLAPLPGIGILHTKTFEYLAARRPILVLADEGSELRRAIFTEGRAGYLLGTKPEEIAAFITGWRNRGPRPEDFYEAERIRSYSREMQAERLLGLLESADQAKIGT